MSHREHRDRDEVSLAIFPRLIFLKFKHCLRNLAYRTEPKSVSLSLMSAVHIMISNRMCNIAYRGALHDKANSCVYPDRAVGGYLDYRRVNRPASAGVGHGQANGAARHLCEQRPPVGDGCSSLQPRKQ